MTFRICTTELFTVDINHGWPNREGDPKKGKQPKEVKETPHPKWVEYYGDISRVIDLVYESNPELVANVADDPKLELWRKKNRVMSCFCGILENECLKHAYKYGGDNFIRAWTRNNPTQRSYEDVGIYPTGVQCPANMFNLWRDFAMEQVTEYEEKKDELDKILNHILILCNRQKDAYEYLVYWVAQMIQYPAVKSICPTMIAKEGCGKGTFLKLLKKMLGVSKVFETAHPSRDVWGDFNGRMADTFLVNLNELSKKEMAECVRVSLRV
jgi:hypothetical protein